LVRSSSDVHRAKRYNPLARAGQGDSRFNPQKSSCISRHADEHSSLSLAALTISILKTPPDFIVFRNSFQI
jgi:hypothetical protein